jgi:hypothetical protein
VQREVERGPYLLLDGTEVVFVYAIEVEHVQEVFEY